MGVTRGWWRARAGSRTDRGVNVFVPERGVGADVDAVVTGGVGRVRVTGTDVVLVTAPDPGVEVVATGHATVVIGSSATCRVRLRGHATLLDRDDPECGVPVRVDVVAAGDCVARLTRPGYRVTARGRAHVVVSPTGDAGGGRMAQVAACRVGGRARVTCHPTGHTTVTRAGRGVDVQVRTAPRVFPP